VARSERGEKGRVKSETVVDVWLKVRLKRRIGVSIARTLGEVPHTFFGEIREQTPKSHNNVKSPHKSLSVIVKHCR
jgi:hypothetical protein